MKKYSLMIGSTEHVVKADSREEAFKAFKKKLHTTKIKISDVKLVKESK